jgi:predicted dehydrogenase
VGHGPSRHASGLGRSGLSSGEISRVAVVGGGRWAREILTVLSECMPASAELSAHSLGHAAGMHSWASRRFGDGRISVSEEYPRFERPEASAVVVANAARAHEPAALSAMEQRVPTLVEKPFAMTGAAASRMVACAEQCGVLLAPAHVFLFARYIESFGSTVAARGDAEEIRVVWTDPASENRHSGTKRYDSSVPVFVDWLPHVISILSTLEVGVPGSVRRLAVSHGGAQVELDFAMGEVPCHVLLRRESDQRRRLFQVATRRESIELDFSREPGVIRDAGATWSGDPQWEDGPSPVFRMLSTFLTGPAAAGDDSRFDVRPALQACHLIDEVQGAYEATLVEWLKDSLISGSSGPDVDNDMRYSLTELLQREGRRADTEVSACLDRMWAARSTRRGRELARMIDPGRLSGILEELGKET